MFSFPDLTKMQSLFEEGLQSFAEVRADVKTLLAVQAEILERLENLEMYVQELKSDE